jgi:YHS domain-containing protein
MGEESFFMKQRESVLIFFAIGISLVLFLVGGITAQADAKPISITVSQEEKELYLSSGGKYTQEDIVANGSSTRAQKFIHFVAAKEQQPKKGDYICPITSTKASEKYTWIIGGKVYRFCCPLCIDAFLLLAKTHPEEIKDPEDYLMK